MIRHILVLVSILLVPTVSMAKSVQQTASITQSFFKGLEAEPDQELVAAKKSNFAGLENKVSLKIQELGLSVVNLKDHGVASQEEYRVRKARSQFPVLYFDVTDIRPMILGRFTFDLVFAKGSEFFAETENQTLHSCRGIQKSNGSVEINLDSCLKKHIEENEG